MKLTAYREIKGAHAHYRIFVNGANIGPLCVRIGEEDVWLQEALWNAGVELSGADVPKPYKPCLKINIDAGFMEIVLEDSFVVHEFVPEGTQAELIRAADWRVVGIRVHWLGPHL